jgi:GNAT superfamily N-acetyltransferase
MSTIRPATLEDSKALCMLLRQLGYDCELPHLQQALANGREHDDSSVYVYERSHQVVGFISLIRFFYFPTLKKVTRLTAMCVDEQHRNCGIGSELLRFVEHLAADYGDTSMEVTCSIDREQAHRFYLQHGYASQSYRFVKRLATS